MTRQNSSTSRQRTTRRAFLFERLETRECMAADSGLSLLSRLASSGGQPMGPTPPADYGMSALEGKLDEQLVGQLAMSALAGEAEGEGPALAPPPSLYDPVNDPLTNILTDGEVELLLARGAAASATEDAIIAIVDRNGRILGVRTEDDVVANFAGDTNGLVFAIDGAVAKARTAAFFANGEAPLTSRTIRNLSQSTITQREVESNPTVPNPAADNPFDPASPLARTFGPGFVAPIGVGGHFPQGIPHTPPVDLFGIEHQSRDSLVHPGLDGVKGSGDDIALASRFNVDPAFVPAGKELFAPESYGVESNLLPHAQARGIATLPGGIPIYKFVGGRLELVGGIGVFFPGPDGFATFEQNFKHARTLPDGRPQKNEQRLNAPKVLEAEWIAYAAVGGVRFLVPPSGTFKTGNGSVGVLNGVAPVPGIGLPFGRIDLVGITLEIFGPNPTATNRQTGVDTLIKKGWQVGRGDPLSGDNQPVTGGGAFFQDGLSVPEGWLVTPHASPSGSSTLTAADVTRIIEQGIDEARLTRAAIRLNLKNVRNGFAQPGAITRMVFAVADRDGNVLGLYRMFDATVFSIDVAVAKSRNTAYYANANLLEDADKVDDDLLLFNGQATAAQLRRALSRFDGVNNHLADLNPNATTSAKYVPLDGLAFTNRTFRFLAEPRYPAGVDGSLPGVFSSLLTQGINRSTAENWLLGPANAPLASSFFTVFGFDAFHLGRNFHSTANIANQNGVVFFPGSSPLYLGGLQGGFGVSGDGVDQDDVVTFMGHKGYDAPANLRADRVFYRGVRLPFQKFNRNPQGGV
jgi:uncharacterized protein GlcG (DUF336 family)